MQYGLSAVFLNLDTGRIEHDLTQHFRAPNQPPMQDHGVYQDNNGTLARMLFVVRDDRHAFEAAVGELLALVQRVTLDLMATPELEAVFVRDITMLKQLIRTVANRFDVAVPAHAQKEDQGWFATYYAIEDARAWLTGCSEAYFLRHEQVLDTRMAANLHHLKRNLVLKCDTLRPVLGTAADETGGLLIPYSDLEAEAHCEGAA